MHNFFVKEDKVDNKFKIFGDDFFHIKNVLRMNKGDKIFVSFNKITYPCTIDNIGADHLTAEILDYDNLDTNLPIKIYLFQGLPKSDKLEFIIQKAVELGVEGIIPVQMKNCVVKIEDKKKDSKLTRLNAISESAAKQSKRNFIPEIFPFTDFKVAIKESAKLDHVLVPYENQFGMDSTIDSFKAIKSGQTVGVFIGPEGGFDQAEIKLALEFGAKPISLGKRILRTETAAVTALSALMLYAETSL